MFETQLNHTRNILLYYKLFLVETLLVLGNFNILFSFQFISKKICTEMWKEFAQFHFVGTMYFTN